jgi:hypothetical protein
VGEGREGQCRRRVWEMKGKKEDQCKGVGQRGRAGKGIGRRKGWGKGRRWAWV